MRYLGQVKEGAPIYMSQKLHGFKVSQKSNRESLARRRSSIFRQSSN